MEFELSGDPDTWFVQGPAGDIALKELPRFVLPGSDDIEGGLSAPMPGKILTTEVSVGQKVRAGQLLVILEAMKMEHRITAPTDGVVTGLRVEAGDQVDKDVVLVEMETPEGDN